MMRTSALGLAVLAAVTLGATSRSWGQPPTGTVAAPAALEEGRRLFVSQGCYQCHGLAGQGSIMSGPALVPMRLDDAALSRYVRAPSGVMPAFSPHILPQASLARIAAYLRSMPPGRPAASIPLLSFYVAGATAGSTSVPSRRPAAAAALAEGKRVYAANCAACHGADREGGAGPNLQAEGATRNAEAVLALLAAPPPGMPQFVPGILSPRQAHAVATFVVSGAIPGGR